MDSCYGHNHGLHVDFVQRRRVDLTILRSEGYTRVAGEEEEQQEQG